jgi:hypothetical protein
MVHCSSPRSLGGEIELGRIFGRTDLIAAEEARSSERREYAQVAPRAEA